MHPIMSDIDLSVRRLEREMEREAVQHRLLVSNVARELGLPGLGTRMVHRVWQFIDPRGFALAQYQHAHPQQEALAARNDRMANSTLTPIHVLPVTPALDDLPDWRKAA